MCTVLCFLLHQPACVPRHWLSMDLLRPCYVETAIACRRRRPLSLTIEKDGRCPGFAAHYFQWHRLLFCYRLVSDQMFSARSRDGDLPQRSPTTSRSSPIVQFSFLGTQVHTPKCIICGVTWVPLFQMAAPPLALFITAHHHYHQPVYTTLFSHPNTWYSGCCFCVCESFPIIELYNTQRIFMI